MTSSKSIWHQSKLTIAPKRRGFHIISQEIVEQLAIIGEINIGVLHLFIQHTSASLTINENADPTVRLDLENYINRIIPENTAHYLHIDEGPDDMPAHIKASVFGNNLTIPISNGALALGTWQGVYLGEHRNNAGSRYLIATVTGQ